MLSAGAVVEEEEVAKAKNKAYDELYEGLDTNKGENTLYLLARQRHTKREMT